MHPTNRYKKRENTELIVIHCAATPPSMDIGVEEIRRWHLKKGWTDIGYHYVIRRDGTVEVGRNNRVQGAHAKGYNHESVSICLVGGVAEEKPKGAKYAPAEDNFTPIQYRRLYELIKEMQAMFPDAALLGHRDLPNISKDCPSFDVRRWFSALISTERTAV